jgi:hypothetical protein
MKNVGRKRTLLAVVAAGLLIAAAMRMPRAEGQAAVPLSRPGQEDLTFWVNHNGLEQLEVAGEVGFGDMARILMRRRSNAPLIRQLRDRFTFKTVRLDALSTPDLFRVEVGANGPAWKNRPERFVLAAGHTFNLPLTVVNSTGAAVKMQARFTGETARADTLAAELAPRGAGGYFLRVVESEPGARKGRLSVAAGGREIDTEIAFDVRPLVNARIKLVDEDGRPTEARVYLTASDGLAYAPAGSSNRYTAMSAEPYFHAAGEFAVDVPAGHLTIEATRGQEYELEAQTVEAGPGPVTLRLRRWVNMAARGWYSSDAHIHANYTADHHQVVTRRDVWLYTHAEDLNVPNMMVANAGGAFLHDIQYFEGRASALSDERFIMYWNEEMRSRGTYGHMSFFNLKRLVYPLYTGFPNTPYPDDYPPNYAQAEAARKQGGVVTYVHPANAPTFEGMGGAGARELPVDLALGQVDALDVVSNLDEMAAMELWYKLLNCGFKLGISAGTDSFTNVADHYAPGGGRVYAHAGGALRYGEWIEAYKRGRTFASNGPVIFLTVNGKEPGEDLAFPAGARERVRVRARMMTQVPVERFEVVINGRVALTRDGRGRKEIDIEDVVPLEHSAWIAARAIGPWHRLILNDEATFAHTSPVYARFGQERVTVAEDARFWDEWIEKLIRQVTDRGRFSTPARRQEVIDLFRRAQAVYRRLAGGL